MRVLVLTKIFPNREEPLSAPFNRQQIAALASRCQVEVIAPIPWFPGARILGQKLRAGRLTKVEPFGMIDGLSVRHPRALYLPIIGSSIAVPLYSLSVKKVVESHRGRFDILLASWLYPDACSALSLSARLGVPCVVKAHGSDVQQTAQRLDVEPIVRRLLPNATAVVAPSKPLVRSLIDLGGPKDHTYHIPNGVDRSIFMPRDRLGARKSLGLPAHQPLIVFVGRLTREKGVLELLQARSALAGVQIALIGDGPLRASLDPEGLANGSLIAPGAQPLLRVADWMAAADVIVLPSWSEGTPNVVLEAIASGRPVVATNVGGIPDILPDGRAGLLIPPKDPKALAGALSSALSRSWNEREIARYSPPSWERSAEMLEHVLRTALSIHRQRHDAVA